MLILVLSLLVLGVSHAEHEAKIELAQAPASASEPAELRKCQPAPYIPGNKDKGIPPVLPEPEIKKDARAAKLDSVEVMARLIYAETLSTGFFAKTCEANSYEDIMKHIAGGVMFRVDRFIKTKNQDPYYSAVFENGQFSTSFYNAKKGGNYWAKAFLCPLSAQAHLPAGVSAEKIYAQARKAAEDTIATYKSNGGLPEQYKRLVNFFYPYSDYHGWDRPGWAHRDPTKGYVNLLGKEKPCVEFYKK